MINVVPRSSRVDYGRDESRRVSWGNLEADREGGSCVFGGSRVLSVALWVQLTPSWFPQRYCYCDNSSSSLEKVAVLLRLEIEGYRY